jgi:hypothetical protein
LPEEAAGDPLTAAVQRRRTASSMAPVKRPEPSCFSDDIEKNACLGANVFHLCA